MCNLHKLFEILNHLKPRYSIILREHCVYINFGLFFELLTTDKSQTETIKQLINLYNRKLNCSYSVKSVCSSTKNGTDANISQTKKNQIKLYNMTLASYCLIR